MENRKRNRQLKIHLTDEEYDFFVRKQKLAGCKTMSHFIRKCVAEKELYEIDLAPFRDLQALLSNATNNINQIAKRVNSTGIIYKDDINDMRSGIDSLSKKLWDIHALLLARTQKGGEDDHGRD